MKKIFVLFIFLVSIVGIFVPKFVSAENITVSGALTSDTTWSPPNVYIMESSFRVPAGVTLTIEAGTVIKGKATGTEGPSIYGKFIARGTSELPIIFTSFWNDAIGGDTDDTGPSVSAPGEWQGLYFKPGSEGTLEYIDLSYAGYTYVGIENDGGMVDIKYSKIHDNSRIISNGGGGLMSAGDGIYNKSGTLSITHSTIENNITGVRIDSGIVTISDNEIKNNTDSTGYSAGYGISAYGPGKLTLTNNIFSGNDRTGMFEASKEFIHSGNSSTDIKRRAFQITGLLSQDATLSAGDLPYIIEYLTVPAGITLNIEPGVIIKMEDRYTNGSITIQGGNLIAKGTAENKIYITSLKDDSIGGDTNGDGDATIPVPRSWASIFLENGSNAEMDYVTLGYGGYNWNGEYMNVPAAIYQRGAELSISNSLFKDNHGTAIYQDAGTTTINKSELVGDNGLWSRGGAATISQSSLVMTGYGIYNDSGKDLGWWWETRPLQIIDARGNWWGSADGPNNTYAGTPTGSGTMITDNVLYTPFLTTWPLVVIEEPTINPVIIIPGIMGSAKKNGMWLIDPILHTYDDLIATLEANGYEKEKNLFTFPYEWRDSNVLTANLLKSKIASVIQQCTSANLPEVNCNKVDLVAHSMGGLVAREYIQSGQYQDNVDQLIFLGTPHKGSPKAYLQWEAGEFPPDDLASILLKLKFDLEAVRSLHSSIFNYIHNRPISSVQELLPIFDYLKNNDTGTIRTYSGNYPRNLFLESLNTNSGIHRLLNSGIRITNITGNTGSAGTIDIIRVNAGENPLWIDGKPDGFDGQTADRGLEKGSGDGTVTVKGSVIDNSITNEEWANVPHDDLPRETSARIFNILTNEIADNVIYLSPVEKIFSIQLQSPIDVVITAPDGKRIGKNFATGEEYNEIVGAFYSGYNNDDEEYITIPNPLDGEYKIEVQGTDNGGEYGVLTSYIAEETLITNQVVGVTKPNQITELNTQIDSQNPEILETERVITLEVIKNDINGAYDLGWIKDKKIRDSLIKQVEGAVKLQKRIETIYEKLPNGKKKAKRIERVELRVNKILLKLFEKELDFLFKKNKITQEALDLLKLDIKYLLENN